jgi:hypothetical protein
MGKPTVFISFDYEKDRKYKNLLVAWDKNDRFNFKFYDSSVTVAVNSDDAAYIRSVIKGKISDAQYLLCIVGEETHKSGWVSWEIDTAKSLGKQLIAVKTASSNTTPPNLLNSGARWAMSFTFEAIKKAVENG